MTFDDCNKFSIFSGLVGSKAYGTSLPTSDTDIRGCYVLPKEMRMSLFDLPMESEKTGEDTKIFELKKLMELAIKATPNIVELLFLPSDCILQTSKAWELIRETRHMFMTKKAIETHTAYAISQIKKARGRNKLINNPIPAEKPDRLDFCWIIPKSSQDLHPISLKDSGIDLSVCRISAVPHFNDTYLIYKNGKGVFKGDMMVYENTPMEEAETDLIGLFVYQHDGWTAGLNKWKEYWDWMQNRNSARWELQEKGIMDYDVKNMQHLIRLLYSGESIIKTGEPIVRFEGETLQFLRQIREGKFSYDEVLDVANKKMAFIENNKNACTLPERVDSKKANDLFKAVIELAENK